MNARRPSKYLSIRGVAPDLARALAAERRRSGQSLNETVLELLRRALGLAGVPPPSNGLGRYAGTWSADDLAEFERATACFEEIDEDLWK